MLRRYRNIEKRTTSRSLMYPRNSSLRGQGQKSGLGALVSRTAEQEKRVPGAECGEAFFVEGSAKLLRGRWVCVCIGEPCRCRDGIFVLLQMGGRRRFMHQCRQHRCSIRVLPRLLTWSRSSCGTSRKPVLDFSSFARLALAKHPVVKSELSSICLRRSPGHRVSGTSRCARSSNREYC